MVINHNKDLSAQVIDPLNAGIAMLQIDQLPLTIVLSLLHTPRQ
jgi:hypothetical protein